MVTVTFVEPVTPPMAAVIVHVPPAGGIAGAVNEAVATPLIVLGKRTNCTARSRKSDR